MVKDLLSGQLDLVTNTHLALTLSVLLSPMEPLVQYLVPTLRDLSDLNAQALLCPTLVTNTTALVRRDLKLVPLRVPKALLVPLDKTGLEFLVPNLALVP